MKNAIRSVVRAAWFLSLLVAARGRAADSWIYAKTDHFEVLSCASEAEARLFVTKLERFRETFLSVLPGPPFHQTRTTLVIFDKENAFAPFKPLRAGVAQNHLKQVAYMHEDEAMIALSVQGSIKQKVPMLYHSYVSLMARGRGYNLPPWLLAGLAGFYETIEIEDRQTTVGARHKAYVESLHRESWLSFSELLEVNYDSPVYTQVRFFAQSWALVHFLLMNNPSAEARWTSLNQLIAHLQTGVSSRTALETACGARIWSIEGDLRRYVINEGRYAVQVFPGKTEPSASAAAFRPATDFERKLILTNLRWRARQNGDATYQLFQMAELQPTSPRPFEVLGSIMFADGERLRAAGYWKDAVRLGTTNPVLPVWLARESLSQCLNGVSVDFRLPATESEALRGWLDGAIAIDENYAEAWDWLALTEALSAEPRAATIRELQAKRTAWGRRPRVVAALALIALRAGNTGVAEALADVVAKDVSLVRRDDFAGGIRALAANELGVGGLWSSHVDKGSEVLDLTRAVKQRVQEEKMRANNRARK